ncbi:serine/threonine protein kinase [Embleya sp. NBC_00896]|nr:serine/threonine protein kinase [Embleya sp. NBC_00896]
MDPLIAEDPSHIGPYRLIARLGAGGMGRVYLARSEGGRTVAVKVVHAEYARHPEFRRRFGREVNAARRVGGEWTAAVLDADTEAPVPWVATQYVPGPSLYDVVAEDFGALPEHSVRVLGNRLALALTAIHDAGLIHRDLKPSNVLVTVDGPRVIDFGIVRALDTLADSLQTRTGVIIGSPGFMAPEQVRGLDVTPAGDVFCLGAVLAYAATGRPPFAGNGNGLHAQLYRVAAEEPDLEGVPHVLLDLIRDCLEKDPARRPTPPEVAARTGTDHVELWLPARVLGQLGRHAAQLLDFDPAGPPTPTPTPPDTEPTQVVPPTPTPPMPAPPMPASPPLSPVMPTRARRRRRTRAVLLAALVVAVIAAGAGLIALGPSKKEKRRVVPNAFVGTWEGHLSDATKPGAQGVNPTRMQIRAGGGGDRVAEFSWLDQSHRCTWTYTLESTAQDSERGVQEVTFGNGRLKSSAPKAAQCPPYPRFTLVTRTVDDRLDFSGGHEVQYMKAPPPDTTPVPDDFTGQWLAEEPFGGPDSDRLASVRIDPGSVGTSPVLLQYGTQDGRRCYYSGEVFSVRAGVLHLGIAGFDPGMKSDPGCAQERKSLMGTTTNKDYLALRATVLGPEGATQLRRVSR